MQKQNIVDFPINITTALYTNNPSFLRPRHQFSADMAAPNTVPQLSADEIDDILYLTRTNDTAELLPYLSQLSQSHSSQSPASILEACVDEYSGNTAFHYAAANGSTGTHTPHHKT